MVAGMLAEVHCTIVRAIVEVLVWELEMVGEWQRGRFAWEFEVERGFVSILPGRLQLQQVFVAKEVTMRTWMHAEWYDIPAVGR
jgi:hypothetical protein